MDQVKNSTRIIWKNQPHLIEKYLSNDNALADFIIEHLNQSQIDNESAISLVNYLVTVDWNKEDLVTRRHIRIFCNRYGELPQRWKIYIRDLYPIEEPKLIK